MPDGSQCTYVAAAAAKAENIELAGLMTMAPLEADQEECRAVFDGLRQCRDDLEKKLRYLLEDASVLEAYTANCKNVSFETPETYYQQILSIYGDENENI